MPTFPSRVWIMLVIVFASELATYTLMFSFFTYCTNMIKTGAVAASAIINAIYLVTPMTTCVMSGIADGRFGRRRLLVLALVLCFFGYWLVAISSMPFMFRDFPLNPYTSTVNLCLAAVFIQSVGMGCVKVCTNPMMADEITLYYKALYNKTDEDDSRYTVPADHAGDADAKHALHYDALEARTATAYSSTADRSANEAVGSRGHAAYADNTPSNKPTMPAGGATEEKEGDAQSEYDLATERCFASLFRYIYWVSNMGAMVGILVMPMLRNVDQRRVQVGSSDYSVGYYYGFSLAAISLTIGLIIYLCAYRKFTSHRKAPTFLLYRLIVNAVSNRIAFACGSIVDDKFHPRDWLDYACYHRSSHHHEDCADSSTRVGVVVVGASGNLPNHSERSDAHRDEKSNCVASGADADVALDEESVNKKIWLDGTRRVLHLCVVFLPLPVYWLVCNQFSTTLMFLGAAVDLPSYIPPDVYNNISTITLLAFLPLFEYCICPNWRSAREMSARLRMSIGFLFLCISMLWCAFIQIQIDRRGSYVSPNDDYELFSGQAKMSASWLIFPYVLQGFAASFVDTTAMEVAYTNAPEYMKGTVVGLFALLSSASGLLGVFISPAMRPQNATIYFFAFGGLLFVVTIAFYFFNRNSKLNI